jgi:hypothetical protein
MLQLSRRIEAHDSCEMFQPLVLAQGRVKDANRAAGMPFYVRGNGACPPFLGTAPAQAQSPPPQPTASQCMHCEAVLQC